jgi:hypothetical protein
MREYGINPPGYIYNERFFYIYGLYSRHGRFFPPYNVIPDINYSEFIQNLILLRLFWDEIWRNEK